MLRRNKKGKWFGISLVVTVLFTLGVGGQAAGEQLSWTITQLTNNHYIEMWPVVSGTNVVWHGYDGRNWQIFYYDRATKTTTQLTDDDRPYPSPGPRPSSVDTWCQRISGQNAVWMSSHDGHDFEIFYYDGVAKTVTQLTDNSYWDERPSISGTNVVWLGGDGGGDWEIFLYDAVTKTTTQLTNNTYDDIAREYCISGPYVVWDTITSSSSSEVFLYNITTKTTTQLTNLGEYSQVSGSYVAWQSWDGHDDEIFLYDIATQTTTQISDNNYPDEHINMSGSNVAWKGWDGHDYEIFFYDGTTTLQLTENNRDDLAPKVSGSRVAWSGPAEGGGIEVFLYDADTKKTTQLTNNAPKLTEEVHQFDGMSIVWHAGSGRYSGAAGVGGMGDAEIFLATLTTVPDALGLLRNLTQKIIDLNLQHMITNNLDGKLSVALNALEDFHDNNNAAVINNLNAFIDAVEAQGGDWIPEEDADALITDAREIIAMLSGT